MTKEQEEAIKRLKNMNDGYTFKDCNVCDNYNEETKCCDNKKCEELKAIETVLSMLEEKEKELQMLKEFKEIANSKVTELTPIRIGKNKSIDK